MSEKAKRGGYTLNIPLDASQIKDYEPGRAIRVLVTARDGFHHSQTVELSAAGTGEATFEFEEQPGMLRVALGPDSASDEELQGMQTLNLNVTPRQWLDKPLLRLPPIVIPPYYWHWWWRWCRTYTIRGRVLCPDGQPVPGAEVCAHDVDMWWWWSSIQQVGCDTTDANGAFEITFRWCCGWWPWWWWRHRYWQLEPYLVERIQPVLQKKFEQYKIPIPDPKPNLAIFEELLAEDVPVSPLPRSAIERPRIEIARAGKGGLITSKQAFSASALDQLRLQLKDRLPVIPELQHMRLWPWWPWHPWWDCTPDIIFRVTQDCQAPGTIIVDEGVADTRWNIPTTLNVTLVANDQACCIEPDNDPPGVCMVITHACDDPVEFIGGNPGAPAAPAGYRNPGLVSIYGDRPYAGVVPILGVFGNAANVDYYEFEWSDDGGLTWDPMPPAAAGAFSRQYWGHELGGGPLGAHWVTFAFTSIDGRRVAQSREDFQTLNDPGSWGWTRFWTHNRDRLMNWRTENTFGDGTYQLRVLGWNRGPGNTLINPRVLPLCNTATNNGILLTIDNRLTGAGSGHPTTPDHPCGTGTVHTCTTEPDTDFLDVQINGKSVGPCGIVDAKAGGQLVIDFMAHDPDGHLACYSLIATYAESGSRDLLTRPSAELTPGPLGAPVPPAAQVGPTYAHARQPVALGADPWTGGAVAPTWNGGTLRLTLTDLSEAFPISCAYQLELRAYKRTIADCQDRWPMPYENLSEFSLTVMR